MAEQAVLARKMPTGSIVEQDLSDPTHDKARRKSFLTTRSSVESARTLTLAGAVSCYENAVTAFEFLDRYFENGLVGDSSSLNVQAFIADCINAGFDENEIEQCETSCVMYGGSLNFAEFLELTFILAAKYNVEWKRLTSGRWTGEHVTLWSKKLWVSPVHELFEAKF